MPSVNRAGKPYVSYKLGDVAASLGLRLTGAHRTGNDIAVTEAVFRALYPMALTAHKPVVNAAAHPQWARVPAYMPSHASVHFVP